MATSRTITLQDRAIKGQRRYRGDNGRSLYWAEVVRDDMTGVESDFWFDSDGEQLSGDAFWTGGFHRTEDPESIMNWGYRCKRKQQGLRDHRIVVQAAKASKMYAADDAFLAAGYTYGDPDRVLVRKGNASTGEGFWDSIIEFEGRETRIVHYGCGEYVSPHQHDEPEVFYITGGRADFWSMQDGGTWTARVIKKGDMLEVPALQPHCLVAHWVPQGLTMHVPRNDNTRSVTMLPKLSPPWQGEPILPIVSE